MARAARLRLRANAGHQAAISAGLASARGDYVVTLDADLQDPPEVIAEMLEAARREASTSSTACATTGPRTRGSSASPRRRSTGSSASCRGTSAHADAGDFRLMSRATVDAVNNLPEHNRVLRFIVPALGFPSDTVEYKRDERAAGASKYPLLKMLRLSVDSLTGFSIAPLRLATFAGFGGAVLAVLLSLYTLVAGPRGTPSPAGRRPSRSSPAVGAVQLVCVGILGEYIGRMYAQLQGRPTYFIAYDSLDGRPRPSTVPPTLRCRRTPAARSTSATPRRAGRHRRWPRRRSRHYRSVPTGPT